MNELENRSRIEDQEKGLLEKTPVDVISILSGMKYE